MAKKTPKLIPPDLNQCQAEKRVGSFMSFGKPEMVRCTNAPIVVAAERVAPHGSMSLCWHCWQKLIEHMGVKSVDVTPIPNVVPESYEINYPVTVDIKELWALIAVGQILIDRLSPSVKRACQARVKMWDLQCETFARTTRRDQEGD